jgi:hypothetical protein
MCWRAIVLKYLRYEANAIERREVKWKYQATFLNSKTGYPWHLILYIREVGGSNFDRVTFDPRCVHAFAHSVQANSETAISYDHKCLLPNPDLFAIRDGILSRYPTFYNLYSWDRVITRHKDQTVYRQCSAECD